MKKATMALVSTASVALTAAIGWWGWTEYQQAQAQADIAAHQMCVRDKMRGTDVTREVAVPLCNLFWTDYR